MSIKYVVALGTQTIFDNNIGPFLDDKEDVMILGNDIVKDIFKKYNYALNNLKFNDDDVIAFIHEDIKILDSDFEKKVEMVFNHRNDIGILGVYGTTSFPEAGGWWLCDRKLHARGHIYQGYPGVVEKPFYMSDGSKNVGFFDNLTAVDGCCFFMNGKMAKRYRFDERTFDGFHFYDCDTTFSAIQMGYKVAVADILVEHQSEGPLPDNWKKNRIKFLNKWKNIGIKFPVTIKSFMNL
jgi:hypothetical protein